MGAGQDALRALLAPEGWSVGPAALAAACRGAADATAARAALLNMDLCQLGTPGLPGWASGAGGGGGGAGGDKRLLQGPMVGLPACAAR